MKVILDWRNWIYGLVSALIGGGAGAVVACISAAVIKPDAFNLSNQFHATLKLMGVTFILNGILSMCFYLKQSPLPKEEPQPPTGGTP